MTIQKILSDMRRAVNENNMIHHGDKIAVGLSGGKDSIVLLTALAAYRRFSPEKFDLCAITVDLGLDADYTPLQKYCDSLNVPFHLEKTDIGPIIFQERKEKNPCSLCSKMRRGALNTVLTAMGNNVLALGHHADDLVETLLLSLIYEGRLSTFAPVSFMDRSGVTMIRPLIYAYERDIAALAAQENYPVVHNPCPANHLTQREYMKNLIVHVQQTIPFAKDRMLGAITHPDRYNLWNKPTLPKKD